MQTYTHSMTLMGKNLCVNRNSESECAEGRTVNHLWVVRELMLFISFFIFVFYKYMMQFINIGNVCNLNITMY